MSPRLTSHSPDLRQLQEEGYHIEIRSGLLLMHHVPYVDAQRTVRYGTLVSQLSLAGDATVTPETHVAMFSGAEPCDHEGRPLEALINSRGPQTPGANVDINYTFSHKPAAGYRDYHEKMTTYAAILVSQAQRLDPAATATVFADADLGTEGRSVFHYEDTATSRAGIGGLTRRFEDLRIAIVGLGGTGSYILDLVAKSPVREIHLYDGDKFLQHNAFRSPGAATREDLAEAPPKAEYFAFVYAQMRDGVVAHPVYVDATNVEDVCTADFVFLSVDDNTARRLIVEKLEQCRVPFIDVGMGVYEADRHLSGLLRVTTSTPERRRHVHEHQRIPMTAGEVPNDYGSNIQIAELNAFNACLAVIKWKKLYGFYLDLEEEMHSVYQIDGNVLTGEDTP
ncbi:ThiF family adenylyltransferase [Streptomyces lincolnensis]|uniref:ThiF family adenylyltransferase n=1 Tax=Streptomyces lincolnensis TaxID=1915 RepID=UPI001E41EC63|nr:ThiF family adenylyltransferase [Streptomyces lincolnensis]MCD7444745.1 ThiF family adenylyltransferase [Streptomyces lincolnensis]